MADDSYDVIVIGTSQGGRFLPVDLAQAGKKVGLVERDQPGGTCVNTGCTPTKTMVASARLAYQARRGAEYGVRTGPVSVDLAAVRERKRAMVAGVREKAVVDADTGQILGATVLGTEDGEIMTIIKVAMMGKLPYTAMANAIFTHPLLAEGLNSLFMTLDA